MKVFEIDGQNVENELHEKVVERLNNSGQGSTDQSNSLATKSIQSSTSMEP